METLKYIISTISGGVILELAMFFYPDFKKLFNSKVVAKNLINKHSDSIIKAADELFGKIFSLAKEDFKLFTKYNNDTDEMNKIYVLYLFASFWASLGILKQESNFIHIARIKKGKRLLNFVTTYESKRNRILERSFQRAIGESIILESSSGLKKKTLYDFTNEYNSENSNLKKIFNPLERSLFSTSDKTHRQKILLFGIIILALLDFLDKNHKVVRKRQTYKNKLSAKTKDELEFRVFKHYLPFVKNATKYY
ncbi:MAG: hypothetical protein ACD_77C00130G0001 [uncultured bacterium]|nr:MAG: hypothetical protein ACD_77C00130G0001 [uncultured bacterium]HBY00960.1 hypothetical protein [Rikenellaceae bacterium]